MIECRFDSQLDILLTFLRAALRCNAVSAACDPTKSAIVQEMGNVRMWIDCRLIFSRLLRFHCYRYYYIGIYSAAAVIVSSIICVVPAYGRSDPYSYWIDTCK